MRLFSYCIPVDDGAAPNPFWGVCTLTICKSKIRRVAEIGDWVVGVGSVNVGGYRLLRSFGLCHEGYRKVLATTPYFQSIFYYLARLLVKPLLYGNG